MLESMRKFMQVGLVHFMAYPQTTKGVGIEEAIRKTCQDDYFDAIENTWIEDPEVRGRVKKLLDSSRLTVAFGGQPMLLATGSNLNDLDEARRQAAVTLMKQGIDQAYEMGAVAFGFLAGRYAEETKEEAYQALVQSTKELCAYAAAHGNLKLALEVFDYDLDKRSLIGPAPLAKRFAEEITQEHDNFGLMVDLSHIPMIHETIADSLETLKDYIIHAHMGNTVIKDPSLEAYGDTHPRFGFPHSENDVEELGEYLRKLLEIGFLNEHNRPIVSFEVKPWGAEDPDVVIANAKRTLNLAWAKLQR